MTRTKEKYLHDKPLNTIFYEHSSHPSTLLDGLNCLRQKEELLDITFIIEGNVFRAHKAVLSACSDYFRAMFTDNMLEARQTEICLNGITAKGFNQILEYAYTSHLALNLANVQDVLEAASHVQMVNCIQACSNYLQSQIDLDNCVDIVTIAETYSLGQLRTKVYRFMSGHLLEFSNSPEFFRLTPQQLENLLAYDFPVDCSEPDVLRIVLSWFFHVEKNEYSHYEKARELARQGSAIKFTGPEPFCGIAKARAKQSIKQWLTKETNGLWEQMPGQRQAKQLIKERSAKLTAELLSKERKLVRQIVGLLSGHCKLNKHFLDVRLAYAVRIIKYIHFKEITKRKLDTTLEKILDEKSYEWQILYRIILQQVYLQSSTEKIVDTGLNLLNSRGMEMAVLKIGGFGISGITNEITYCFASERKWKHLTSIPHVEQCNYGTAVFDNELYIIGGCFNQSLQENIHPFGFKYSPRYNKWSTLSPMKIERCRFSLNVVGEMLYAVGGTSEGDEFETSTCECYNPRLDAWYMIPDIPSYLSQHAGASIESSFGPRLYISGGIDRDNICVSTVFCYEVNQETWRNRANMLQPRADHVMLAIGKKLYCCGGWTEDVEMRSRVLIDTIDVYDTEKDSWEVLTKVPTPRYHAGIVCVRNKIYFIGGFHSDTMFDKDTAAIEYYNLETNSWTIEDKYPQDIWEHTCATLYIPKCRDDMEVIPTTESSV